MAEKINLENKKTVLFTVWLVSVTAVFLWLGVKESPMGGNTVKFDGVSLSGVREALVGLSVNCGRELLVFLAVTLASRPIASILAASVVLAVRGLALGTAAAFCSVNSVPANSVAVMLSYAMISVLIIIYTVIRSRGDCDKAVLTGLYFIMTGAAVLLKMLPLLFI